MRSIASGFVYPLHPLFSSQSPGPGKCTGSRRLQALDMRWLPEELWSCRGQCPGACGLETLNRPRTQVQTPQISTARLSRLSVNTFRQSLVEHFWQTLSQHFSPSFRRAVCCLRRQEVGHFDKTFSLGKLRDRRLMETAMCPTAAKQCN